MTVEQAQKQLQANLKTIYDDREAITIAQLVMEKLTGFQKAQRLIYKNLSFTDEQIQRLKNYTAALLKCMPVQYVLQEAWFAGLKFYVDEHVLIPRPETEELAEKVIAQVKASGTKKISVIDIGTGSGCIAISLKKKLNFAEVYALDISEKALEIAKRNALENSVDINYINADILSGNFEKILPVFDIIVSNPPYIKESEAAEMADNVLLHEPKPALFVPDNNPLIFYKAIIRFAKTNLKKNGRLYLEINALLNEEIKKLLVENNFRDVKIETDLYGNSRFASAIL